MTAINPVNQQRALWFDAHYVCATHGVLQGKGQRRIGKSGVCRYCGRSKPDASFKKEAHAFPECIGNKWLISLDECDECNDLFSMRLEDDFGKFTGPMRTMGRIRGKGFPKYKSADGELRVEIGANGMIRMSAFKDDPRLDIDEANKRITIQFVRQSYVPMGVFKCLVKMAMAVMPQDDLPRCQHLMRWLREEKHSYESFPYRPLLALVQFTPGPMPTDLIEFFLLRRVPSVGDTFFMQFIVRFGNLMFQIVLPFPDEDKALLVEGKNIGVEWFANPWLGRHEEIYGKVGYYQYDLSSPQIRAGEALPLSMRFAESEDI